MLSLRRLWGLFHVVLLLYACQTVETVNNTQTTPMNVAAPKKSEATPPAKNVELKPVPYKTIGHRYAKDGLYREAIDQYQLALNVNENDTEAKRALGIVQVKVGQYKNAIANLVNASISFPNDFEVHYYLAEAYRTQDNYADAIFHYKLALIQKPDHKQTLKALAWSYFQIRYYRAAFEIAQRLKKIAPNDVQADIIIARILNKMGRDKTALSIIRKALVLSNQGEAPYLKSVLGEILESKGECDQAQNVYQEALKDQPLLAGALLGFGKCLLKSNDKSAQARDYIERAVRIKPKLIEAYYWLAKSYEKTDPEKSTRFYQLFQKKAAGDPAYLDQIESSKQKITSLQNADFPDSITIQNQELEF